MAKFDPPFWRALVTPVSPSPQSGRLLRMVENQEQVVTLRLVDSLDEQAVLEEILEDSKPDAGWDLSHFDDYLLTTPWRYPPLKWGSRFGRSFERSLFYGSLASETLLAEVAYYRWVFVRGPSEPFPKPVRSEHDAFGADYQGEKAFDLRAPPFAQYLATLSSKTIYQPCQTLGTVLREMEIDLIVYRSARCQQGGANIALFHPRALRSRRRESVERWLCEATLDTVTFKSSHELVSFELEDFLDNGEFPTPA